jgi:hypothetical protein
MLLLQMLLLLLEVVVFAASICPCEGEGGP